VAARTSETPAHPTSIYGATKHVQETLLSAWCGARGTALSILRLQNVYGAGQSLLNPYTGLLPLFARIAAGGDAIDVYEDGKMTRDFVHITDIVEAFSCALGAEIAEPVGVYDIGSGVATPILDVARLVSESFGGREPTISGKFRDGDVRHAWCDTEKTTAHLGWSPSVSWRDGISEYIEWFSDQAPIAVGAARTAESEDA
jgi:dTDP-L-rhamnose 4-epimerase